MTLSLRAGLGLALLASVPAAAQDGPDDRPRRTRVALGPQLVPSYPGSDQVSVRPFIDVSRVRGDDLFPFEAPDESFGFALFSAGGVAFGPVLGFEGSRTRRDLGADLRRVGATIEPGAFAQYQLTPAVRLRAEARRGVGGHKGWVGSVGADYVARRGDDFLFSIGPRVTLADGRYQRAYFGVRPDDAARTGLPAFRPDGGASMLGATTGLLHQFGPRWGVSSYLRYDRLIDDAGRSPVVRRFGSRDQFSGGIAATYTFGRGR